MFSDLSFSELKLLKSLSTPLLVQNFIDTIQINFEKDGETLQSPRRVLRSKKAHCIEAALLAATSFWFNGKLPLILDLKADGIDEDHVLALYKINGCWGAISKSNHATLRFRDPIYRTPRELAISYFHEYFDGNRLKKSLRSYSKPFDLRKIGSEWITAEEDLWDIAMKLDDSPHFSLFPKENEKFIRPPDSMERKTDALREWSVR